MRPSIFFYVSDVVENVCWCLYRYSIVFADDSMSSHKSPVLRLDVGLRLTSGQACTIIFYFCSSDNSRTVWLETCYWAKIKAPNLIQNQHYIIIACLNIEFIPRGIPSECVVLLLSPIHLVCLSV